MGRWHNHIRRDNQQFEIILAMCEYTPTEYKVFKWECAHDYLLWVQEIEEKDIELLFRYPEFWTWWDMEWYRRDSMFFYWVAWDFDKMAYEVQFPDLRTKAHIAPHGPLTLRKIHRLFHTLNKHNILLQAIYMELGFEDLIYRLVDIYRESDPAIINLER